MKAILISLLVCISLIPSEDFVQYGPDQCLRLLPGESLVSTTDYHIALFDPFHFMGNAQAPIHKTVQANGYTAFFSIGIGFDSDETELYKAIQEQSDYEILQTRMEQDRSTGLSTYHILGKKNGVFNHKYFFTIPEPLMTLIVNEVSSDYETVAKLYNAENYAQQRRGCEN